MPLDDKHLVEVGKLVAMTPLPLSNDSKVKPIKRLTMRHRRIVALFLQGIKESEIAIATGYRTATIYAVLKNPAVTPILDKAFEDADARLKAMAGLATDAVRDAMIDSDNEVRLKGVDRWAKMTGRFKDTPDGPASAEDVVQRLIQLRHEDGKLELTIAEERRS